LLRRAIEADKVSSVIFYGPPGTGKTALATVISKRTGASFIKLNAVSSNVKEIRGAADIASRDKKLYGKRTILLIDEIHRFNKAQQDVLMPFVEDGTVIMVGTTTENPYFSVNSALLSRSQVFEFKVLSEESIKKIIFKAVQNMDKGLGNMRVNIADDAVDHLARISDGDARRALGALELAAITTKPDSSGAVNITLGIAEESIQKKAVVYDSDGDAHYDVASAYIKSMRGSDPDAAVYWLAKMIVAGEDPRFIARRLVICASEDVGNADPQALILANAAMQVSDFVGFPEARIVLCQATVYVACAPKSNTAWTTIDKAISDVENERTQEVPDHLKDANYSGAKKLGRGQDYKYAHSFPGHWVDQEYMPKRKKYYEPTTQGYEKKFKEYLDELEKKRKPHAT
ncbi:MAG: replication-associated recombination protein A, partial [Candidatus Omnitrophica bacterium]|nr:replication-associated recombination protein A [Candidatus Omnitrophota bacterium]